MPRTLRVLVIEDSPDDEWLVLRELRRFGFDIEHRRVESAVELEEALESAVWDAVISDHNLPQFSSLDAIDILRRREVDLPFVLVSGTIGEEVAATIMKAGAHDYVMKGNLARLGPAVARELKEAERRAEHRRARAALERSEAHFRTLIENSTDIIAVVDADARYTYVSPSFTRVLGYAPQELLGQIAFELLSLDDVQAILPRFHDVLSGRVPLVEVVYRIRHRDGTWRILESAGTRIATGEDGRPAVIVNSRDITSRKAAEEALRETQGRLQLLNDISLNVKLGMPTDEVVRQVVRQMASHFPQYRVSYGVFDDAARLTVRHGIGTAELPSVAGASVDFGDAPDALALLRDGKPLIVENAARDPRLGGLAGLLHTWHVAALLLMPLCVGGSLKGVIALACPRAHTWPQHELTTLREVADYLELAIAEAAAQEERRRAEAALKRSERQLRQAQKMEAIGRLAGGIAHDFNNLLTAIIGYSELLLSQLPDDDEMNRRDVNEIKQAGERAAALTRQLLAFSRQQVLAPQVVNLNAIVASMDQLLRRLIGEDVKLSAVADPLLGDVLADPGQIEQVVMNLSLNARDAMPHGGSLTLRTANVDLGAGDASALGVRPGRYVLLEVQDTGVGMDAETQGRAFEPFFTTKDADKGTGLGLATVYGIVQQSNGCVAVTSAPGDGATFRIYLPRVDAPGAEPRQPRQARA